MEGGEIFGKKRRSGQYTNAAAELEILSHELIATKQLSKYGCHGNVKSRGQ